MLCRIFSCLILCLLSFGNPMTAQQLCLSEPRVATGSIARHQLDDDSLIRIPTVVHVIYRDSSTMLMDSDVFAQIELINRDYRHLNEDQDSTPGLFRDLAADCRIEFCLASWDPDGNPTNGVTRIKTEIEEIGLSDQYYQSAFGGLDGWDPARYLNIWVCEISEFGDIAGFASGPEQVLTSNDGVIIDYRYFGSGELAVAPYNRGRTLTHEIGHWLGLNHLWGSQPGCNTDDGIDDTPRQFDRYRGCPDFPQLSCGSSDMFMNFMDLTDDACMNLFTEGQKEVMRNNLFTTRTLLRSSEACSQSTLVKASSTQISFAPNPAMHYLEFLNHEQGKLWKISITDLNGQVILVHQSGPSMDISRLQPGIYFVQLRLDQTLYVAKFLKL